jgi:hypothetical protein
MSQEFISSIVIFQEVGQETEKTPETRQIILEKVIRIITRIVPNKTNREIAG